MNEDQRSTRSIFNWRTTDHLLFIVQVIVILIVVITSITNLTLENGNLNLWTALLSSCLGYILPNPKIKPENINREALKLNHTVDNGFLRDPPK
jgi:hypothetical protein